MLRHIIIVYFFIKRAAQKKAKKSYLSPLPLRFAPGQTY